MLNNAWPSDDHLGVPSEFFSALPYLMTILALVAVSSGSVRRRLGTPAALGTPYVREES